jgi:CDP-paratose 2-epimerase
MRKFFFGENGDTAWMKEKIQKEVKDYTHYNIDIRNKEAIFQLFKDNKFDLIIHTAAQPAHDWPKSVADGPHIDFEVNALGTLNLLEATRQFSKDTPFIFTSTNKVYGDRPNSLPLVELETRWEIECTHPYNDGINETMSIDQCKHSLFGTSKVAADILTQEYGKYFDMPTVVFRGGCLFGEFHSGVKMHGFLSFLIKSILKGDEYTIFGYNSKQVRDNIHSFDVASAFYEIYKNPKCGEVFNIGGTRFSNCSMIEAIKKIEDYSGKKAIIKYIDEPRSGDHIWYISSMETFKRNYPNWKHTYNIDSMIKKTIEYEKDKV